MYSGFLLPDLTDSQVESLTSYIIHPFIPASVSNISSTLMERHDNLKLQAMHLYHLHKLSVGFPVVLQRSIFLRQTPPYINHYPFNAGTFQSHQTCIHCSRLVQAASHCYCV
ncbi:hypothetical protein Ahy_B01g053443 isoform C [Arachis hypogaea]|uniref:Uncharacterized protein n=1 Tax=Arachis hypogaea TaxID=3818 RepID=A0A445ARX2_ARAHY|nr:hypothetical protein Ahy_B01g053443 isoform C [Arachis hypogaea]